MANQQFWADDPLSLLSDLNPFPNSKMSSNEKYNAITRLIIIISLIMLYMDFKYTLYFLIISLLLILLLKHYSDKKTEKFSTSSTYLNFPETMPTVTPLNAEEWQIPPPVYDEPSIQVEENPIKIQEQYPYPIYGQYISQSSMIPYQEEATTNRSLQDVKPFMTQEFMRNELQYRNDMTRPFINKINREFRGGCYDSVSPYNSW